MTGLKKHEDLSTRNSSRVKKLRCVIFMGDTSIHVLNFEFWYLYLYLLSNFSGRKGKTNKPSPCKAVQNKFN